MMTGNAGTEAAELASLKARCPAWHIWHAGGWLYGTRANLLSPGSAVTVYASSISGLRAEIGRAEVAAARQQARQLNPGI